MNKTNMMNRTIGTVVLTLVMGIFANAANITELPTADTVKQQNFVVKYLGEVDEHLNFTIDFKKQNNLAYTLLVKDESGETLYQQIFTAKNLSKKVVVSPNDEFKKLYLSIVDNTGKICESKNIIISATFVQDYLVKIN
jgi:hypothetical protein